MILWVNTPPRAPGRRSPPRRRWRCRSLRASWTCLTLSVIAASSARDSPVNSEWASCSDTRKRSGSGSPPETDCISAAVVVNRSVVGKIVWWCSLSSRRVSAITWPMVFGLIPSSSDSTLWAHPGRTGALAGGECPTPGRARLSWRHIVNGMLVNGPTTTLTPRPPARSSSTDTDYCSRWRAGAGLAPRAPRPAQASALRCLRRAGPGRVPTEGRRNASGCWRRSVRG
jgi:hypothetical protein